MNRSSSIRALSLLGLVWLTCCADQRRIDRSELKSDLKSGISLATEARLYLQFSAEGRTRQSFSKGHLHYLAEEANRTEKELRQAISAPEDTQALDEARLQFRALSGQLAGMEQKSSDANARYHSMLELEEIGKAMQKAKSSL